MKSISLIELIPVDRIIGFLNLHNFLINGKSVNSPDPILKKLTQTKIGKKEENR